MGSVETVVIRSYPKSIFLYPSFLAAVLAAVLAFAWRRGDLYSATPGNIFMVVFSLNLLIFAWDFSRTSFFGVIALAIIGILLALLLEREVDFLGPIQRFLKLVELRAHPHLFVALSLTLGLVLLIGILGSRLDFWEVHGNEVLHVTGLVRNVERFPAPSLTFRKEIPDVFEYALLRSGTLVLQPSPTERHVLTNVLNVTSVEQRIERLLSTLDVTIEEPRSAPRDPASS